MMFMVLNDGINGQELWKSDGTRDGTMILKNIVPFGNHSQPAELTPVNDLVFFTAWDGKNTGRELWKTDGTPVGTTIVKEFLQGDQNDGPIQLTELDGILYFLGGEGLGRDLWRTDGSLQGTYMVKKMSVDLNGIYGLTKGGGKLFFNGYSPEHGNEVWVSDGTEEGTFELKDIKPGTESGIELVEGVLKGYDGGVFFMANDGVNGKELWTSDGTSAGTKMVKDFFPGNNVFARDLSDALSIGGKMYFFFGNNQIWSTDGTEAGTVLVKIVVDEQGNEAMPQSLMALGDKFAFSARNEFGGTDVWISDGTDDGTVKVKTVHPTANTAFSNGAASNGQLYFSADDGTHGPEPWVTDGTPDGTYRMHDLVTGTDGSFPSDFVTFRNETFFVAYHEKGGQELFKVDGSAITDVHQRTMIGRLSLSFEFQQELYYYDDQGMWKSDGTAEGTVLVKPLLYPREHTLVEFGGKGYFIGGPSETEDNVYVTDGTAEGTKLIFEGHAVSSLLAHQGTLYFLNQMDLYKTDGTDEGNELIMTMEDDPHSLVSAGDYIYFSAGELWQSNGTPEGTVMVKDLVPGDVDSHPRLLLASGDEIYFITQNNGVQLWKSDGTEAGTVTLKSFSQTSSFTMELINNTLFFVAPDETGAHVLWKSDGTSGGTVVVKKFEDGGVPMTPARLRNVNGKLYLAVTVPLGGNDLWKSDGTTNGTVLVKHWDAAQDLTSPIALGDELYFISSSVQDHWGVGKSDGTANGTRVYYVQEPDVDIIDIYAVDDLLFINGDSYMRGLSLYVMDTSPSELCRDFSIKRMEGTGKACIGSPVELHAIVETASASLTYTWTVNGTPIPGEAGADLLIESVNATHNGIYKVSVTDGSCSAESNELEIRVKDVPNMIEGDFVQVCSNNELKVFLSSFEEIYTQGYNVMETIIPGGVIADENNAVSVPDDTVASDYLYYDRYTNTNASMATVEYIVRPVSMLGCAGDNITLFFQIGPSVITDQPDDHEVCEGETVNLEVAVTGTGTFRWKKNNITIQGATGASLVINSVTEENAGDYLVVYDNGTCVTESEMANVEVFLKPTITEQPQDVTIEEGALLELFVSATGEGNTYVWKKNNMELGAESSPIFSKPDAIPADNGNYQVVVTNLCGTSTSDPAAVLVLPAPQVLVDHDFDDFMATAGQFSFPQDYTVSGTHLQGPVDIEVEGPFEVSLDSDGNYASTLSLPPVGETLSVKTVFVKFTPEEALSYDGYLRHYSLPAIMIEVPVHGNGLTVSNEKAQGELLLATYPNPVQEKLLIEFKHDIPGTSSIVIFTLEGQQAHNHALLNVRAGDSVAIKTDAWKSGAYYMVIRNAERKLLTKKILKIE